MFNFEIKLYISVIDEQFCTVQCVVNVYDCRIVVHDYC